MNSAGIIYVQLKMIEETIGPSYKKFLKGINLTKLYYSLYYSIKEKKLDGFRIIEKDISQKDALPNGSYIYQTKDEAYLYVEGFKDEN